MFRAVVVVVVILALIPLPAGCAPRNELPARESGKNYTFGEITVCRAEAQIRFTAEVSKAEGWVQHLVQLSGYQWLEENSALVSLANLSDLQKGFAALDWKLWDELWQGIDSEEAYGVQVYLDHGGRKLSARTLVNADDPLHVGDLIFLGCPYFDAVALSASGAVDCLSCPVFPLEQEALRKSFVRESGESGFEINAQKMFAAGSQVEVIIKLP
jgi:hypothetical protein